VTSRAPYRRGGRLVNRSYHRVGIGKIDNKSLATAQVGPMTQPLSELYTQRTATEGVQVVE
jgi:hypothetical protein